MSYSVWFLYRSSPKVLVLRAQLPACNTDFTLIEKRKKVSYIMVPSQWKYVIAESRINKPFTFDEIEQPHFKDLEVVQSIVK
jgi:hypothetical protein